MPRFSYLNWQRSSTEPLAKTFCTWHSKMPIFCWCWAVTTAMNFKEIGQYQFFQCSALGDRDWELALWEQETMLQCSPLKERAEDPGKASPRHFLLGSSLQLSCFPRSLSGWDVDTSSNSKRGQLLAWEKLQNCWNVAFPLNGTFTGMDRS